MGRLLFFVFLAVPLIEIGLFIVVGRVIGVWPTLLGIVVIAVLGSTIIRRQGIALLREIRDTTQRGVLPARSIADAMMVGVAGVLMVVPGYFTDLVGLLLLVPPVRTLLYRFVLVRLAGRYGPTVGFGTGFGPDPTHPPGGKAGRIDGDEAIDLDANDYRHR